jgi:hypothetical protein
MAPIVHLEYAPKNPLYFNAPILVHKSYRPCEISTETDSGSAQDALESGP